MDSLRQTGIDAEGDPLWLELDADSTYAEWLAHPIGGPLLREALDPVGGQAVQVDPAMGDMPLRTLAGVGITALDTAGYEALFAEM